jgi:hypothetical protein
MLLPNSETSRSQSAKPRLHLTQDPRFRERVDDLLAGGPPDTAQMSRSARSNYRTSDVTCRNRRLAVSNIVRRRAVQRKGLVLAAQQQRKAAADAAPERTDERRTAFGDVQKLGAGGGVGRELLRGLSAPPAAVGGTVRSGGGSGAVGSPGAFHIPAGSVPGRRL